MKKSGPKKRIVRKGGGMAKKAGPKKGMMGGGMAKKSGPKKKKIMKGGGMAKKSGPAKKKVMKKGGMAKKAGPKKGMMGGGMAKKSGPMKKKPMMKKGGMAKKSGPMKKKVMKKGGMAKKAGPKKGMANGGSARRRNLRDEEARVIGRQDNAADEMRRVKRRTPRDSQERMDKRSEMRRVGARERDARDEMARLRRKAVDMGMNKGGKTQGYNDRLDESLGMRNRKAKPKPAMSNKIPQHKRMAMGENVLTGKMMKKGGQTMKSRRKESEGMEKSMGRRKFAAVGTMDKGKKKMAHGGRTHSATAVKINMGMPKTRTVTARGMGAATKGGQFRENT